MIRRLDLRAVVSGVLASLGIAVPAVLTVQVLDERRSDGVSSVVAIIVVVVVGASFGVGGFLAGARSKHAPLIHGVLAALGAYGIVQGVAAVRLATTGESIELLAIPFFAAMASALGVAGATVADVRAGRPGRAAGSGDQ